MTIEPGTLLKQINSPDDLKKLGVVVKRARYFITCLGKYDPMLKFNEISIYQGLLKSSDVTDNQLSFFHTESPSLFLKEGAV